MLLYVEHQRRIIKYHEVIGYLSNAFCKSRNQELEEVVFLTEVEDFLLVSGLVVDLLVGNLSVFSGEGYGGDASQHDLKL